MKKKKYIKIGLMLFILCGIFGAANIFLSKDKINEKIMYKDRTSLIDEEAKLDIESEAYSYLPEEVKNYVVKKYEEDGTVILTKKNKEKNESYLNPEYIEYMNLSSEEQKNYAATPEILINDYMGASEIIDYASTYNLTNVDGENYTNALKNQQNMGLCWSFAGLASFETSIAKKYNNKKVVFSERQIDYVTSKPSTAIAYDGKSQTAITEKYNPYNTDRDFGAGGNFTDVSIPLLYGLSPQLSSNFAFANKTYTTKSLNTVLDSSKVSYVANESEYITGVNMYELSSKDDKTEYNNVINYIKSRIVDNGALYVATLPPQTSSSGVCYNQSLGLINFIGTSKNDCPGYTSYGTHAMAIIGWDDDYSYSYCVNGSSITTDNESNCKGKWVSGKGTWILRNSWGVVSTSYPKLAYSSYFSELGQYTDVSEYSINNTYDDVLIPLNNFKSFKGGKYLKVLKSKNIELLDKITFNTTSADTYYNIYISTTGNENDYVLIKENIYKEYPGFTTVDVDDLELNNDEFIVKITSTGKATNIDSLVVYTNDKENLSAKSATTHNVKKEFVENVDKSYDVDLYTNTKNVSTGETIAYTITNDNDEIVSFEIKNSYVINNKYLTTISLNNSMTSGTYKITTKLQDGTILDDTATLEIVVDDSIHLDGSGTALDPYMLSTPGDFRYIEQEKSAYYKLANDIDFTDYDFVKIGTLLSPFQGNFDGDNYTISNFEISDNDQYTGFFGVVSNATISNINFEDVSVIGDTCVGVLSGLSGNSIIENIKVKSGYIQGNTIVGSLIGEADNSILSNITNEIDVLGDLYVGGIAGVLYGSSVNTSRNYGNLIGNYSLGGITGMLFNQNITKIHIDNSFNIGNFINGSNVGGIVANIYGECEITNVYNAGNTDASDNLTGGIIGYSISESAKLDNAYNIGNVLSDIIGAESVNGLTISNIYYLNDLGKTLSTPTNTNKVKLTDLSDMNNLKYLNNNVWHINNNTYPTLILNDYYYTSDIAMDNTKFQLGLPEKIILNITPVNASINNFEYLSLDESVFQIDNSNNVICNKIGTANLKAKALDGSKYEKEIEISCVNELDTVIMVSSPTKKEYVQFEDFDITGGMLKEIYKNGDEKEIVITEDMISGFDSSSVTANQEITITYKNYLLKYSISISPLAFTVSNNVIEGYSLDGANSVNYGEDYTFSLIIDKKYSFSFMKVYVNDVEIFANDNIYKILNVKNNLTIYVEGLEKLAETFNVTPDEKYVLFVPLKSKYKDFNTTDVINSLELNENYEIRDSLNNKLESTTLLGTGMKIIGNNSYDIVIRGELTGDGKINQGDVSKLYNYYRNRITLEGLYLQAAKIRGSDTINQGDVAKLYNYYRGTIESLG